jgi:hypothetical protein
MHGTDGGSLNKTLKLLGTKHLTTQMLVLIREEYPSARQGALPVFKYPEPATDLSGPEQPPDYEAALQKKCNTLVVPRTLVCTPHTRVYR